MHAQVNGGSSEEHLHPWLGAAGSLFVGALFLELWFWLLPGRADPVNGF